MSVSFICRNDRRIWVDSLNFAARFNGLCIIIMSGRTVSGAMTQLQVPARMTESLIFNRSHFPLRSKHRAMQNYELMVIFTPVLSEDDYRAAQKKYASLIGEGGGEVIHEKAWGLKSLAYPIAKKTTGLYWVMEYKAPSDFNEKLKVQLLRDDNVMRHLTTALDKYAVEYNERKRSGVTTGTTEKTEA